MLSQRLNDFSVCSAYYKPISAYAQPPINRFRRMLSIRANHDPIQNRHSKYAEHTGNEFYRTLSIRGTHFIAGWAYAEWISSLAEHTRKFLKVEYLGRIEYDFQKSRVTGPWDHKVSVSAKKVTKKISCLCTFKTWRFCRPIHAEGIRFASL